MTDSHSGPGVRTASAPYVTDRYTFRNRQWTQKATTQLSALVASNLSVARYLQARNSNPTSGFESSLRRRERIPATLAGILIVAKLCFEISAAKGSHGSEETGSGMMKVDGSGVTAVAAFPEICRAKVPGKVLPGSIAIPNNR
jgi:hypothetical protein